MMKRFIAVFLAALFCAVAGAGEISEKKIRTIAQIASSEFRKLVIEKKRPWQYVYNPRAPKKEYPQIKKAIIAAVRKKVTPFETRAKKDDIPPKVRSEIARKVAKRFPYKTPGEIALGALKEAEVAYPLVKKGDDVTIRYHRGGMFQKVSGKVQSIRNGGTVYEVGNKLVRVSEIVKSDRQYFDSAVNAALRKEFVQDFQDPKKLAKFKRDYAAHLRAEELEKIVSNEKKGYIFFQDKWVTAKYVTDQVIKYYERVTERRLKVENEYIVRNPKGRSVQFKKK